MEKLLALGDVAHENPHIAAVAVVVVLLAFLVLIVSLAKKRKRRNQSHQFLCERNRKAVIDAIHSFYLANAKAEFEVTVKDLVARDMLRERNSRCPAKRAFQLELIRDGKGRLKGATVTCKSHGDTKLADI